VICETKCIRSHYLLLAREKSLPDLALSFRTRAGPLQPIDATMQLCRTGYPAPSDWPAAFTRADGGLQSFPTVCQRRINVRSSLRCGEKEGRWVTEMVLLPGFSMQTRRTGSLLGF
jgi:hypothetical protein